MEVGESGWVGVKSIQNSKEKVRLNSVELKSKASEMRVKKMLG